MESPAHTENSTAGTRLPSFSSASISSTRYPPLDPSKSVVNCPQCDDKLLDARSLEVHLTYRHGIFSNFQMSAQDANQQSSSMNNSSQQQASSAMNNSLPKTGDQQCGQIGDHGSALNSDIGSQQHTSADTLEFGSVLTNVDSMHMSNSSSQSHLVPSSAMSPMQFDFSSTMMQSPQSAIVSQGPSSTQSNVSGSFQPASNQYLNDVGYSVLSNSSEYGLSHPYSTSLSNYSRSIGYTDEVDYQTGYDRQYSAPLPRFHPYGRSPLPSPSVVKEEPIIKTETQEILDLDSHRFLQNSTHTTAVPQLSGGTMSQLWRPAEQQLSNSPTLPPMPLTGGHLQSMSSSPMFGGPAMHSPNNTSQAPMGGVSLGYHSPVPSNSYHPQGYLQSQNSLPPLGLPKPSPSYMSADSPQSSSIVQPPPSQSRPSNDRPPTEFPTNVKRPKNFKCDVCLKWFTSQGHLKRHYNTTLHKNMEKQKENDKSAELGKPQSIQNAPMQSSILQPAMSPAMPSAMAPAMSPAMPSAMAPAISPAMPSAMPSSVSPAMPSTVSPAVASLPSSDTLLLPSSPRLSNGMTIQPGPDSSNHLMSETDEKTVNPSPLSYQMTNDIQYSETPEQNIQYHQTYGSNPSYESGYNDYSHRPVGLDAYPTTSSNNSANHAATSSTVYHGNFSTNSPMVSSSQTMDMTSSSGYPTQFFQTGPTPMVGGGNTFIRPNDSSVRPSPSPHHHHHPSPQSHSGSYNMSPVVSNPNDFPGAGNNSTNGHFSQLNSDAMGQNRPVNRYSPQDSVIGDFGEKVESMINGFTSITSLHSMESRDPGKRQEISDHYFAEPDGRPPSISPETRIGSALDSASDGSRDSISTTASGGSTSSTTPTSKGKDSKDGSVKCVDCDKVCSSICYLTQHRKRYHSGALDFKCEKCGKKFSDRNVYEEHKLKHAGEKPYKCDECPKQFNHKTDLRRHSCLHTGEKPFHCPTCGKGFIRKDHMNKHQNTHEKKRQAAVAAAAVNTIPSPHLPISMNGGLPAYPSQHIPSNPLIPDHFVPNQYPSMNHHHHPHLPPPSHHNPPPLPSLSQHPSTLPAVY